MQNLEPVSKEEFDAFLAAYPRKLERDVARMCEPPLVTFNDFADGKIWPESVVASYTAAAGTPTDPPPWNQPAGNWRVLKPYP